MVVRMRRGAVAAALLAVAITPSACGAETTRSKGTTTTATTAADRPAANAGPAVLSVRAVRVGPNPSPPYGVDLDDLPRWSVTADGWLLTADTGAGTTTRRGLPRITAQRLDATALRSLRALAVAAALDERPLTAPSPAKNTDALELAYRDESGLLSVQRHVKPGRQVQAVLDALARPAAAFGASHVGAARVYAPAAVRFWAESVRAGATGVPAWPLPSVPLAASSGCSFVTDGAAATVLAAVASAPSGARLARTASGLVRGRWTDGGAVYAVSLRVLLPGETPCPAEARPA